MLICVFTGFSSGLPLWLLINLMPAWFHSDGIDLKTIGLFTLTQTPYSWKFLWSPAVDAFSVSSLGRRRSWLLATQVSLLGLIAALGQFQPSGQQSIIFVLSLAISFASATQDIVIDAFRREILLDSELGLGNAIHVNAYKIASLVPGSLSLILADTMSWSVVFVVTALFMLPGLLMTFFVNEPAGAPRALSLHRAVVEPWKEFLNRSGWKSAALILSFILLYRVGDALLQSLATVFYLDMGYTKTHVGLVAKNAGLWPSVIGGFAGGLLMLRIGINRALWVFGAFQFVAVAGFAWFATHGHQETIGQTELIRLAAVIALEYLAAGLGQSAFVAYIARCTHPSYTATQLALFTSLMSVPRAMVSASSGYLQDMLGWVNFYMLCGLLAIPGMVLLRWVAPWTQLEASKVDTP